MVWAEQLAGQQEEELALRAPVVQPGGVRGGYGVSGGEGLGTYPSSLSQETLHFLVRKVFAGVVMISRYADSNSFSRDTRTLQVKVQHQGQSSGQLANT